MPDLVPLLTPDRHELVELVRDLHNQASPWTPSGLGNHLHWGPQLQLQSSVLSLRRHNQVLEHATGDFTVTVEAGMPLGDLQAVLAERGQWLPIDPPLAGPSSIGGVVARGVSGPLRHKAMGIKDQVIGISLLRSDGTAAKAGGKVVKNVAGYDLMRLLTGSWGSLALITQVTLRTQPIQHYRKSFVVKSSRSKLFRLSQHLLLCSPLALERIEWNHHKEESSLWISLTSLNPEGLEQQIQQLKTYLNANLTIKAIQWQPLCSTAKKEEWLLRVGTKPHLGSELIGALTNQPWHLQLGAGSGLGLAYGSGNSQHVRNLRDKCKNLGGYLTVLQKPNSNYSNNVQTWEESGSKTIIEAVKRNFDPLQQLNRGKLPGVNFEHKH